MNDAENTTEYATFNTLDNMLESLIRVAGTEYIEAVNILGRDDQGEAFTTGIISFEEAKPILDQEGAFHFFAWTKEWVIFTYDYDGYVGIARAPRDPSNDTTPYRIGD
jgi:hypothetical protein